MVKITMKMADVSIITLLLLFCSVITSTAPKDKCDQYVATGDKFAVPLNTPVADSDRLTWKHDSTVIYDRKSVKKHNVSQNGYLNLKNVKKEDAGKYTPEIFDKDGRSRQGLKSVVLCVLDRVPKPTVTPACVNGKVKFTCSVGQGKDHSFLWFKNDKELDKQNKDFLEQDPVKVENDLFKCNVSNLVSSMTSEPVKQKCHKSSILPEKVFGVSVWIFVGSGAGVVLLLIIIVIVCCIKARRKKHTHKMDEQELRLGWTNSQQQQQQHHHHHHQQQQHQHHQHNHPSDYHQHHQEQPAGHTGPRQHRSKQQRGQRGRLPEPPNGHSQPSPRRNAEGPRPVADDDDEKPPPIPQPRKKAPKTPNV